MSEKQRKTFTELGYSHIDTAAIVTMLNRLLCNYSVYQQKLRAYHWNVTGLDFFELHEKFETMYNRAITETDDIAERIRLFGQQPPSTFVEYLKTSRINEDTKQKAPAKMVESVIEDIKILIQNMEAGIDAAQKIKDNGTEHMLKSFIYKMEKEYWMLTSWINQ